MRNGLNVTYRPAGLLGPGAPAAYVFRDGEGELLDVIPAGTWRQRVGWLPIWIPWNRRWDDGPAGCEDALRQWVAECTGRVAEATSMGVS